MRKLASVRIIDKVIEHPNANALDIIKIGGWQVVAKKGIYIPGDLVVYFEIDSFLPEIPEFEFLRPSSFKIHPELGNGFRIKTIKLRGELSQGLLYPLEKRSDGYVYLNTTNYTGIVFEGNDLTTILNVKKYEPPLSITMSGDVYGFLPGFIQKTDQERIQNIKIKTLPSGAYKTTEKLDGSSMTVYYNDGCFGVCSRNLNLKDGKNVFWETAKKYNLDKILPELKMNIAIQGELVGPKIQGNRYNLKSPEFFVFDIYDIDNQKYLTETEVLKILLTIHEEFSITVPSVPNILVPPNLSSIDDYLMIAEGISVLNNVQREGLVFRNENDTSISFKVISNKFLLGEK